MKEKQLLVYPGLLGRHGLMIHGHLIRRKARQTPPPGNSWWRNLLYALDLYSVRPVRDRAIQIEWNGETFPVQSDGQGYFRLEVADHKGHLEDLPKHFRVWEAGGLVKEGEVFSVSPDGAGAISDIDDTLIVSRAAQPLKKFRLLVFRNAHTREATPELEDLLKRVRDLSDLPDPVDFFYVSNSEWNLLPFLETFFHLRRFPEGPFFLQQLRTTWWDALFGVRPHKHDKQNRIEFLLRFFPDKKFVLIGDSSQHDMRIYAEVGKRFTHRIAGIVIRVVDTRKKRKDRDHFRMLYDRLGIPSHFVEGE